LRSRHPSLSVDKIKERNVSSSHVSLTKGYDGATQTHAKTAVIIDLKFLFPLSTRLCTHGGRVDFARRTYRPPSAARVPWPAWLTGRIGPCRAWCSFLMVAAPDSPHAHRLPPASFRSLTSASGQNRPLHFVLMFSTIHARRNTGQRSLATRKKILLADSAQ
jgi:hypothetical protein